MSTKLFKHIILLFALLVASGSAQIGRAEASSWTIDFDGLNAGNLVGQDGWSGTAGNAWQVYTDRSVSGTKSVGASTASDGNYYICKTFDASANLGERGYYSFQVYTGNTSNSGTLSLINAFSLTNSCNTVKQNIGVRRTPETGTDGMTYNGAGTILSQITQSNWHKVEVSYLCESNVYKYYVKVDGGAWSDLLTDNRTCASSSFNKVSINRYARSDYRIDDIYIAEEAPPESADPFEQGILYTGEYNYYLNFVSPKTDNYIDDSFSGINITVKPDDSFSTLWYARFRQGYHARTKLTTKICDSNFENCTAVILPNQTAFINPLSGLTTLDISEKNEITFNLDFEVIDQESEYYKIELWEGNLDNEAITLRHTIPFKITGDVNSTREDIDPVFVDGEVQKDLGFFGNLLRDLFLPSSDFITSNLNEINTLRMEKFTWYYTIKDELTTGFAGLSTASGQAPTINLNLYGSGNVNVLNTTYIDGQMTTLKSWMSAFLWILFGIFVIKSTSNILRS